MRLRGLDGRVITRQSRAGLRRKGMGMWCHSWCFQTRSIVDAGDFYTNRLTILSGFNGALIKSIVGAEHVLESAISAKNQGYTEEMF
ncbi:hypothetical protein DVH24_013171 [Malus domestica]|uniref:Uncharacterized protein n=1 Tax=Malus domestica TaxID=3750 RepID=A0A498IKQ1_MALDO|nr:hypothetical protein DVH24_013171 [Malus domestica]